MSAWIVIVRKKDTNTSKAKDEVHDKDVSLKFLVNSVNS